MARVAQPGGDSDSDLALDGSIREPEDEVLTEAGAAAAGPLLAPVEAPTGNVPGVVSPEPADRSSNSVSRDDPLEGFPVGAGGGAPHSPGPASSASAPPPAAPPPAPSPAVEEEAAAAASVEFIEVDPNDSMKLEFSALVLVPASGIRVAGSGIVATYSIDGAAMTAREHSLKMLTITAKTGRARVEVVAVALVPGETVASLNLLFWAASKTGTLRV